MSRHDGRDDAVASRHASTPRVAVAGCFHETNSFASSVTDREAFERRGGWLEGDVLVDTYAGTHTVVGGFLDGAAEEGLGVVPVFGAYATPAGVVTRDAFAAILDRLTSGLRDAGAIDGVLLELHGAMVVAGEDDPETVLLRTVREVLDDRPVAVVTDLHANLTAERVGLVDVLVGYRTNPRVDTYERGVDAARHLAGLLAGRLRTELGHRRVPVLAAPIAQATAQPPLAQIMARARELERRHGLVDVTVHGGYAYADVPHAGMSFTVTAPAGTSADATLDELAALTVAEREAFTVHLPDTDAAVATAIARTADAGPIAMADTGDNIGGGAPGDGTWLVHALLDRPATRALTTICDPEAAAAAADAGVGGRLPCPLGGKAEALSGAPLTAPATVRRLGDGTFRNSGPMARGSEVRMGPTAVVSLGAIDVVVQSLPVQPNDPEMFRSLGLDPTSYDIIALKGAAALRAGWQDLVTGFVDAGTRGVTDCDLTRLPYRRLRAVWPLHDMM